MVRRIGKLTAVLILFAALILSGCAGDSLSAYAEVDGKEITREDFDKYVSFLWFEKTDLTKDQKLQVLDEMIQVQVYRSHAETQGFELDKEKAKAEYEKYRDQLTSKLFAGSSTMYYARLHELNLSEAWMIDVFEGYQLINTMVDAERAKEPDDEDVEEYYQENKELEFSHGELRKVRHILINEGNFPDAKEEDVDALSEDLAKDLYDRLLAGEDFAELAKEYSQDTSADYGGDIGLVEKTKVVKEFGDVAFAAELNEIAEPVKSQYGWHVIQVTEIQEAGYYELDDEIRAWIVLSIQKERVDTMLANLMEEADIKNYLE